MAKSAMKDLTVGSPMKLVFGFAVPLLFGFLFQQMYNFVDTAIVGRFWARRPWRRWAPQLAELSDSWLLHGHLLRVQHPPLPSPSAPRMNWSCAAM